MNESTFFAQIFCNTIIYISLLCEIIFKGIESLMGELERDWSCRVWDKIDRPKMVESLIACLPWYSQWKIKNKNIERKKTIQRIIWGVIGHPVEPQSGQRARHDIVGIVGDRGYNYSNKQCASAAHAYHFRGTSGNTSELISENAISCLPEYVCCVWA